MDGGHPNRGRGGDTWEKLPNNPVFFLKLPLDHFPPQGYDFIVNVTMSKDEEEFLVQQIFINIPTV